MSMAVKYAMKKRMAKAGDDSGIDEPVQVNGAYAKGGEVECGACKSGKCADHGGMVDRIMVKRMSKGGMVANDTTGDMADSKEAQYDDLVLRDDMGSSDTGANSGDELGNAEMDENDRDLISRIMRSRAKKDRLPRPA